MPSVPSSKDRPNSRWPVGSRFDLLDAWMRNPIEVKRISVATNDLHVVAEDERGIRHYAHTDRIASEARFEKVRPAAFNDLLGLEPAAPPSTFEELF